MRLFYILAIVTCSLALSQEHKVNELNLSAEQKVKMKEYRAEMKACREKTKMKILSILNDEQKIKFLQMNQDRKNQGSKKKVLNIQKVDIKD